MCITFKSWRLYSWMRFDLDVEERVGIDVDAHRVTDDPRQPLLVRALHAPKVLVEAGVVRVRLERRAAVEIRDPAVADRGGDQSAPAPGFAPSSQRRCVMPFVLLLNRSGQSSKKSGTSDCLDQVACGSPRRR